MTGPTDPEDPDGPGEPDGPREPEGREELERPAGSEDPHELEAPEPEGSEWPEDPDDPEVPPGPPGIDPRIRKRRADIQRSQGQRRLRLIVGAGAAGVLAVVVVILLHTGWFSAQAVTVTGAHPHTSDAAIVDASGLGRHPALIDVDPTATARRVEALPFIASARVSRRWPDGVAIEVTERVPVVQMAGPGSSWSLLDGNGRTLEVLSSQQPGLMVFTVHTAGGSGIPPAPVGGSLPPAAGPGLTVCRTLPPAFAAQVVSVTVAPDGSISMALNSGITVLVGTTTDLIAKYKDIAAILAHGTLHATSTIDVTVPASPTVSG
jgi:cell division protein FtsQ